MLLSDLVNIWSWFKTLGQDSASASFCSVPLAVRKMRFRPTCSDWHMRSHGNFIGSTGAVCPGGALISARTLQALDKGDQVDKPNSM